MIPVANPFKIIFPVLLSPRVNACFAAVAIVPFAAIYMPLLIPADMDAVGVPDWTLMKANFAEEVADEPRSKSSVSVFGDNAPATSCQKFVPSDEHDTHPGTALFACKHVLSAPIANLVRFPDPLR